MRTHQRAARRATMPLAFCAALALAACGGGSDNGNSLDDGRFAAHTEMAKVTVLGSSAPRAPVSVRLEGCVVDEAWMSLAGATVHVRGADGRLLGTSFTNARGVFALEVPANADLVVDADVVGADSLNLVTGTQAVSVAACLPSAQTR